MIPTRLLSLLSLVVAILGTSCVSQPYYPQQGYGYGQQPGYGYQQQGYGYQQQPSYGQSMFRYGQRGLDAARKIPGKITNMFRGDDSFWYADGMRGSPSIKIHLGEQMVYLYKGGQLAGGSPISSGQEGYDTKPGRYKVIQKDIGHKSSIYGDYEDMYGNVVMQNIDNRVDRKPPGTRFEGAKMYYFMRIYGGVGMHQGYLPGYAASHGCIRLPAHMAEKFFYACPMGTPVLVTP